MITAILFLAILSVLVLVHEGGHFLAAKKAKILVEEFGFGYPPKIWSKKIGETIYSINWILFGGFVKLYGEEIEKKAKKKSAFWAKSKKARTSVIVAGVLANFILAIFCFSIIYSFSGIPTKTEKVKVIAIAKDSPAEKNGIKPEDEIISVDDEKINNLERFTELVRQKKGQSIKLMLERKKDNPCLEKVLGGGPSSGGFSCQEGKLILFITPRENPPENEGPLGVAVSNIDILKYPFWQMPVRGTIEGFKEAIGWGLLIVNSLKKMVIDLVTQGMIPKDIAGPIGIFQITSGVAQSGILAILQFVGILSVNLAVVNILPIPAFDGGKIMFILYEVITKKRPRPEVERWVNTIGMIFIILLIILITINDVARIIDTTPLFFHLRSLLRF